MDMELENAIAHLLGSPIKTIRPVTGGDISQAFLLETDTGPFFCKIHHGASAIDMFRAEKKGLEAIAKTGVLRTPAALLCEELNGVAVLILQFIETKRPTGSEMHAFGAGLAALHNLPQEYFGWGHSNYIGSLPQSNKVHTSWAMFYLNERLGPQFQMAREKGLLLAKEIPGDGAIQTLLEDLCNHTTPSLLHGDLWNGNYLISQTGHAYLIDPAVYCGDSGVDLAMSRLFGGFGHEFYRGYESIRPRKDGAAEREDIYQLYYLLVHLNLFGRSYHDAVMKIVNRFFGN